MKKSFPYVSPTVVLLGLVLGLFSCRHHASANPNGGLTLGAEGSKKGFVQRMLGIGGSNNPAPTGARNVGAGRTNPNFKAPFGATKRDSRYSMVQTSRPLIAMTFDDGPHPRNTPKLLDMLKKRNIKATFYVVGTNAKRYPELMQRIVTEGHEVGNHTYTHANLSKISDAKIRYQMEKSREVIREACGVVPTTMRPPYGALSKRQREWIFSEFGYPSIMWAVDPRDWQRPGAQVVADRLVEGARPGRILLAHDIHAPTITAMPQTFDRLLAKGFQFVTVSQLIASDEKNNPQLAEAGKKEGEDPKAIAGTGSPDTVGPVDLTPADISKDAKAITLSDIEAWEKLHGIGNAGGGKEGKGPKAPPLYTPLPLKPLPSEQKKEKAEAKGRTSGEEPTDDTKESTAPPSGGKASPDEEGKGSPDEPTGPKDADSFEEAESSLVRVD